MFNEDWAGRNKGSQGSCILCLIKEKFAVTLEAKAGWNVALRGVKGESDNLSGVGEEAALAPH